MDGDRVDTTLQRFLVALPTSRGLFICAKHLFVAASRLLVQKMTGRDWFGFSQLGNHLKVPVMQDAATDSQRMQ